MIDFSKTTFNLAIKSNIEKEESVKQYRFPTKRLEQLLLHINGPSTKIGKEKIQPEGDIPVVTQETGNLIAGYIDNAEPITDLPLIVFGDHSCTLKYVDFKFVRGADGTQLIKVNEEEVLSEFLCHYLHTIKIENSDKYERHFKYLKNAQIPLPPTVLQKKIVAECRNIDAGAFEAKEKIGELQENINEIMAGIRGEKVKLGTIAQFKNGLNYKKSTQGISISIVGVADFKENKSPEWDKVQIIKINERVDDSYLLHKNDLLTVRSNGSQELVGRFMLIDKEPEERTTFSGFSIRVRIVSDEVNSEFLYYILASADIRHSLTTGSNGTNIKSLNQDLLSNLEILLPPLSEQKKIVDKIGAIETKIASLKAICEEADARKEAVLRRELIEEETSEHELSIQEDGINPDKTITIHLSTDELQPVEFESLMAAEPFGRYKWEGFDQSIRDFFGSNQTILVGCYKGKEYREWINSNHLYNIRMGKTKGSMDTHQELFGSTSLLVLYEMDNSDKLSAYKIVGYKGISKEELIRMGYPNKKPRKNYMSFSLEPLELDLTFLVEHHLIERLIELDADHAKGSPIFIEP